MRAAGLPLAFVLAVLPAPSADTAKPAPCKYEQNCNCIVPGITLRWKAAYCMAASLTDDLEQAGVQRCLAARDPDDVSKRGACEQNRYWKERLCRTLHEEMESAAACAQDPAFLPAFIEHGPGS